MPERNNRIKFVRSIPNLRWLIAGLLFLATVIAYVDLQSLSVVSPILNKDLHLNDIQYANVLEAYLIASTCMYVFAGILIDRFGNRLMVTLFVTWWSIANALHAFARSAFELEVCRFLFGVGQAGIWMADEKAVSEWYPSQERAFTAGIVINAGASIGAIISPPLIAWIGFQFGWRAAFLVSGGLGLLWIPVWLLTYHVPERHPRITTEEYEHIRKTGTHEACLPGTDRSFEHRGRWLDLLKVRQTWALFLARVLSDPVWWFYLFWLPKYLRELRGFSMMEIGLVAWLPYLTASVGSVLGGILSGYLIKRNFSVLGARKLAMLSVVAFMPLGIWIAYTKSSTLTMVLVSLVTFCHMAWKTNLVTLTNDLYPMHIVASAGAIVGMGSGLGGVLSARLVGEVVDKFSYTPFFIGMGMCHIVALLLVHGLVKQQVTPDRITVTQVAN